MYLSYNCKTKMSYFIGCPITIYNVEGFHITCRVQYAFFFIDNAVSLLICIMLFFCFESVFLTLVFRYKIFKMSSAEVRLGSEFPKVIRLILFNIVYMLVNQSVKMGDD